MIGWFASISLTGTESFPSFGVVVAGRASVSATQVAPLSSRSRGSSQTSPFWI
ncbi:hypothetical protein D3C83_138540 [compost metagenome]